MVVFQIIGGDFGKLLTRIGLVGLV
jgi:hypothetical protein